MEGSFTAASFQPPAVDPADGNPSRYPFWVLLDNRAYFADRDNATTVQATTSTGHDVKVTFCLADPPAISYFCVHCAAISIEDCCATEPRVVSSAKDLALLCFALRTGSRSTDKDFHHLEYFVYKAASGGKHTIVPVPCSPRAYRHSWHAAIVPRKDDNFLVADLSPNGDLGHYSLHIFSSETNKWSTKQLQLQTPPDVLPLDLPSQTDKVITLGESTVGWVDLWRGIVVCDVLHKEPLLRFLPLPKADFDLHRKSRARQVRDVIGFSNGFINFVEIEHCLRWFTVVRKSTLKTVMVFDVADTISDEELLKPDDMDGVTDDDPPVRHAPAGWKLRTMLRSVDWDYWHKSHTLHVDDISAYPPEEPSKLLSHLINEDGKLTLGNLKTTGFPTFSVYGGNVVHLVSKVESPDEDALLVGVDVGNKKLKAIEPYCRGRSIPFGPFPVVGVDIEKKLEAAVEPYCGGRSTSFDPISCAFSEYLNTTPTPRPCDEEVAAESAQNGVPNGHISSDDTVPSNDEEVTVATESAQNGVPNDHLSSDDTVPSIDEEVAVAAESAQNGLPNDHLSSDDTVPSNVQTQQNSWNGNGRYGGWSQYSYGVHPGYYGNYQQPTPFQPPSLWQPMWSSTSTQLEGYIYARWTLPDAYGRMYLSVPLSEMYNPFALWRPPMPGAQVYHPWPNHWLQGNPSHHR